MNSPAKASPADDPAATVAPILEVEKLSVHFPIQRGVFRRTVGYVRAVEDLSFNIMPGETLGLVGESGCGKTTTGRTLLRINEPTRGTIRYRSSMGEQMDIARLDRQQLRAIRREMRMIFQDPHSSLNPRLPVLEIIGQPLKVNRLAKGAELRDRVADLMRRVGLRPENMYRYPHAFSGGEKQRIGIARALALNPRLVICDEAVSALDVSVQAQILRLLRDLQDELGLTYLFIGHDLAVIQHISDRVAVMYAGRIVEFAPTRRLYSFPKHPYTEALLSAAPLPDPRLRGKGRRIRLAGEVADLSQLPSGCAFHPRCRYAQPKCKMEVPPFVNIAPGHSAACHFANELDLQGI